MCEDKVGSVGEEVTGGLGLHQPGPRFTRCPEWQQNPSHQSPPAGILVVTGDERCTYSWLEVCVCTCLLLYHLETHSPGPSPGKTQKTGTGKGDERYVPQGLPDSKASDGSRGRARPKGSQGVAR